jgi:predicted DNA-binding transcriptional regulator YafY
MIRSSNLERAQRHNAALALIKKHKSLAKAAKELATRYSISTRQAYRYVREAKDMGKKIPIPDSKRAFTVKLSQGLIQKLRQRAKSTGQTISEMVTQALEALLQKDRGSG